MKKLFIAITFLFISISFCEAQSTDNFGWDGFFVQSDVFGQVIPDFTRDIDSKVKQQIYSGKVGYTFLFKKAGITFDVYAETVAVREERGSVFSMGLGGSLKVYLCAIFLKKQKVTSPREFRN